MTELLTLPVPLLVSRKKDFAAPNTAEVQIHKGLCIPPWQAL